MRPSGVGFGKCACPGFLHAAIGSRRADSIVRFTEAFCAWSVLLQLGEAMTKDLQQQYDEKYQQAVSERDFRKRETLFLECERLRKQLSTPEQQEK